MKKILSCLVFVSVFAFGLTTAVPVHAQDQGNVRFDKNRFGPDDNGVYTVWLEAYVTGRVTVTESPLPADIVLVLDRSGSMAYSLSGQTNVQAQNQRINILKTAVKGFVDQVKESNSKIKAEDKDNFGGHRIAVVWFSSSISNGNGYNTFLNVENLTTTAASGTGNNYTAASVTTRIGNTNYNILRETANGGTETDDAMVAAKNLLDGVNYPANTKRSRVVVFFTDGQPGNGQSGDNWMGVAHDLSTANGCISAANDIKNSTEYGATIYSVGLFNKAEGTKDATTTYLSYTSSDYTDKTAMPANNANNFVPVSGDKSIVVSSADALANVFKNIADASTPDTSAGSSSTVLVDIVSTSFVIQDDANLGKAKVYQVENIQTNSTSLPVWEPRAQWEEITNKQGITFVSNPETGEVSVSGFAYGDEWVGWDASYENEQGVRVGRAHGSKLYIEIPIMADENALGGPDVATNAPGSKLTITDKDGNVVSEHEFVSPVISLPVNIHIMKKGLKEGESAKFTIRRTTLPITNNSVWDYVSSVYVTNGESSAFEEVEEEDGTTSSYPVTYVRGLPSVIEGTDGSHQEYVYRIDEEDWGWTYDFDKVTGIGVLSVDEETHNVTTGPIELKNKNEVYSNKFAENPIIFWNTRETNVDKRVRNAESKATNIFQNGGTVIYDDSNKNTGTGRD